MLDRKSKDDYEGVAQKSRFWGIIKGVLQFLGLRALEGGCESGREQNPWSCGLRHSYGLRWSYDLIRSTQSP